MCKDSPNLFVKIFIAILLQIQLFVLVWYFVHRLELILRSSNCDNIHYMQNSHFPHSLQICMQLANLISGIHEYTYVDVDCYALAG